MPNDLPTQKEIGAAQRWARNRLGYLPPGWDDEARLMTEYGPLARWLDVTGDGQRVRALAKSEDTA